MGDLEEQGTASAEQEYGLPVDAPRERSRAEHGSTIVARSPAVSSGEATALYSASTVSYYVTTPIYYVNAEPHLGHAYSTIAAVILPRHMLQRGEDVFFLTGTDEHGEPVALAAEREGVSPQELVDRNAPKFREMVERVGASNDFFIRTTDAG